MKAKYSCFLILSIVAAAFFYMESHQNAGVTTSAADERSQLEQLTKTKAPFKEFSAFFETVARAKGAGEAFELMRTAPLPFGLDTHLLGHVVGEILYEQEGIDGIKKCTHEFRNACSHTIVIGALLSFGEGAFSDISKACYEAPGGKGAYTMCFHGLGHGVLAFNSYDMPQTVKMCEEFSTAKHNGQEGVECFGGAIMEIIGGGGHSPELWQEKRLQYLDPSDPYSLCAAEYMPDGYKPICYIYMTPFAFEALGADMANPDPSVFTEAFILCSKVSKTDALLRQACYGGLGKEFIGIALGRYFGPGAVPEDEKLSLMYQWCREAPLLEGKEACVRATVDSLYWGGEQPYSIGVSYCGVIEDEELQNGCFEELVSNVAKYIDDPKYRQEFCEALPDAHRYDCNNFLNESHD